MSNNKTECTLADARRRALRRGNTPSWRLVVAAASFALLAVGCSSDGTDASAATNAPAASAAPTTAAPEEPSTTEAPTTAAPDEPSTTEAPTTEAPEEPPSSQPRVLLACDFSEGGAPNGLNEATGRFRINNPCTESPEDPQPIDIGEVLSFEIIEGGPMVGSTFSLLGLTDASHIYGGVAQGPDGRFFSTALGTGEYADEVIHLIGHSPGDGAITYDWYVGDGPPPFGAIGEFDETVEIGIECVPADVPPAAASGVTAAETCTYTSDDPRFSLEPSNDLIWEVDTGEYGVATGTISYYNAMTDSGAVRGGLVDTQGVRRWAGVTDGLGDVDKVVHEIGWAETDADGVTIGVMLVSFGSN